MSRFDKSIERRGSGSYKWDANERLFGRADILPFWVADMDFATPAPIIDAIRQRLAHPLLGYEERSAAYRDCVRNWLQSRHDWAVPEDWLMFCPPSSIVGMYGLVTALTEPGDGIVVPTPTYGPLIDIVRRNGRRLIRNPLVAGKQRFELDIAGMAASIDTGTRMILLCSPHNPTGRVYSDAELEGVAQIATDHDLIVVSDEVHADLVRPGQRHRPFGSLGLQRSATVISPNKAFNTAGLPQSSLVMPDAGMRSALREFLDTTQVNHDSSFGGVAMMAAYSECRGWLDELVSYIDTNHQAVADFFADRVPGVRVWPAEATYLAWLDCRDLGLTETEVMQRLVETGGVGLYGGSQFGEEGDGFLRMNIACPRAQLQEGLAGIEKALGSRPA